MIKMLKSDAIARVSIFLKDWNDLPKELLMMLEPEL